MQSEKVAKNCKSVFLKNGVEITYCEFGEENSEIMVMGEFYFHTFIPLLEALAENYHVYGVVMDSREPEQCTEFAEDGEVDWPYQWGKDVYDFITEMNLSKVHYVGKCHGSVPGWYLVEKHPEVLKSFVPIGLAPMDRTPQPPTPERIALMKLQRGDFRAFTQQMVRKPENVELKIKEASTINLANVMSQKHRMPLEHFKTNEDMFEFFSNINIPMMYMQGTADEGFKSGRQMILKLAELVPGIKTVIYYGERHFLEMDIPKKMAMDIDMFVKQIGMDC